MKFEQQSCYQVSLQDNAATALGDIPVGMWAITGDTGAEGKTVKALEAIPYGHKIALRDIAPAKPSSIRRENRRRRQGDSPGAWVHLHNAKSEYDLTSAKMDLETMILRIWNTPYTTIEGPGGGRIEG